ncbi:hypothetical protein [Dickeya fangzhongdai]|uniref:hypothetical protein n=1 Tax=Dickeya fangzhongdai TaxID=1778540 RepID=UPI003F5D4267
MKPHYAFTADHLQTLPPNLRALIGKHFADSRWAQTCVFYRRLSERYRRTLCFHAALHHRWCVYQLEEMDEMARERIVSALNELRSAFGLPENRSTASCCTRFGSSPSASAARCFSMPGSRPRNSTNPCDASTSRIASGRQHLIAPSASCTACLPGRPTF